MPRSTHLHKSMLLRGVKFLPPALDRADIEATKGKANRSGRSFGGAPLRSDYSNGRGRGQISYADGRPNPFAAHINPGYAPPGVPNNARGPPPQPPYGWVPPPPGTQAFRGGPPPPPGEGVPHGYPPQPQHYGYAPPPPPLSGYYNGGYVEKSRSNSGYGAPQGSQYNNHNNYSRGGR